MKKENKTFIRELIREYKKRPELWDPNNDKYKSKTDKEQVYQDLAEACKKFAPRSDSKFIKAKIAALRTSFRREFNKVSLSSNEEEAYIPQLWYYDQLLFLKDASGKNSSLLDEDDPLEDLALVDENQDNSLVEVEADQQQFITELITAYRDLPYLWDMSDKRYKNRALRKEGFETLVNLSKKYVTHADEDYVKTKINCLRRCFKKEYTKVVSSRNADQQYEPSLWYYSLFLFLEGEPSQEAEVVSENGSSPYKVQFWTREYTLTLLDLMEQHPVLCQEVATYRNKRKRLLASKQVTKDLIKVTGKAFKVNQVWRKIQILKQQFYKEYRKVEKCRTDEVNYTPKLWFYNMATFLEKTYVKLRSKDNKSNKVNLEDNDEYIELIEDTTMDSDGGRNSFSEDMDACSDNNYPSENLNESSSPLLHTDGDVYDTIGVNVTRKLRSMREDQRLIAEKILNEVMYHGQMEELTSGTQLVLK